jgi:hypothetical protein
MGLTIQQGPDNGHAEVMGIKRIEWCIINGRP